MMLPRRKYRRLNVQYTGGHRVGKQGGPQRLVLRSRKYRRINIQYTGDHRVGK